MDFMAPRPLSKRGKSNPKPASRRRESPGEDRRGVPGPLREVPGLVRRARAKVADAPEALRHLADLLEDALNEFATDDELRRMESASIEILTTVAAAGAIILDLAVFAGGLAELARVASATEAG